MSNGVFTLPLIATDLPGSSGSCRTDVTPHAYIAGEENALLQVLWDAVANEPPRYNPLTLFGPSGTGKSHLISGLCHRVRCLCRERHIWATSGSEFARQFARAIELDALAEFREKALGSDIIVIDSLDEMSTKPAAQQELLQLVDVGLQENRQWIFALRSPPSDWACFLPGLRSRIEGGLTIPVALPQTAARREIIRSVAAELDLQLDEAAVELLAASIAESVGPLATFSQLRSSVVQHTLSASLNAAVDTADSRSCATGLAQRDAIRRIARHVARHFEVKLADLLGPSRRKTVVQARAVAIYLARSWLHVSFDQLGSCFGNRDHTTILHAFHKISGSLESDTVLRQTVDKLWLQLVTITR